MFCVMSAMNQNYSINETDAAGKTALWHAIERGSIVDVEWILKCGADVNKTYHSRQTPLMFAVEKGHAEYLQVLFDAGANIDSVDSFGMSSVMIAAKKGHLDCLQILVTAGASLHFRDIRGRTALQIAVEENRCECTKCLIEAGADINQHDFKGISALTIAIYVNCEKCLQSLVQTGALVDEFNKSGKIPLMIAVEKNSLVLPVLIKLGAKIDLSDSRGRTSTVYAAREGRVNSLFQLVQAGANVNLADYRGQTALMIAAEAGHVECVECLVKGGAKLEQQDSDGRTALMLAAAKGYHNVLEVLLQNGEQWKDMQCRTKRTALTHAIMGSYKEHIKMVNFSVNRVFHYSYTEYTLTDLVSNYQPDISCKCLQILLAAGANPNICDINNMSPLMYAALLDNTGELCQHLIEVGADVSCMTEKYYKKTALLFAAFYGNVKFVRKLVESGASVNVAASNGDTALMYLALTFKLGSSDIYDTIVLLLDHGADVNAQEQSGITPLMCAARDPAGINVMSLLISHGAEVNQIDDAGYSALDYTIGEKDTLLMNAKYLLENGAKPRITSVGNFKSTISMAVKQKNVSFLLLFLRSNLELSISWDDFYFLLSLNDKKMLQAIVLEGLMPYKENNSSLSILRTALNLGCLDVAKYLLTIGYLNIVDIYCDKPDSRKVGNSVGNPQIKPFFKSLYSQPWPLVKLAFVVVSSNMGTSPKRKDHIKSSGLPDRIQRMLLFQEPTSKLCIEHWDSIPVCFNPQGYENLPKPHPLLYYWPFGHNLMPCDCTECSQTGYKFVLK